MTVRSRLPGWLILASVLVIVVSVVAFGSTAIRTPEFNALRTPVEVAAYIAPHARQWVGLSLGLLALNTALLVGLAAGPDALAPMVAAQSVSPERAVVGTLYEHLAGLTGGFALAAIAVALVLSRRMPRIGMVVAVLATVINVASPFVGAVVGLVRSGRG